MHRDAEEGAAAVEMVLVAASFFVLVLGCVQLGLWYYARSVVVGAVNEGARAASAAAADPGAGERAVDRTVAGGLGQLAREPRVAVKVDGDQVTVTMTARLVSVVPFLDAVPVSATATAHRERLAATGGP